jgi:hypothetical protein
VIPLKRERRPPRRIRRRSTASVEAEDPSSSPYPWVKASERDYSARFPSYDPALAESYPFYRFRTREVKLFYERILSGGTMVTARVIGEKLTWQRRTCSREASGRESDHVHSAPWRMPITSRR